MNPLHWLAFGVTVVLMFSWDGTSIGVRARAAFKSLGLDDGWAWPICGLAAFWATYFALKLGVAVWSRSRTRLDDV